MSKIVKPIVKLRVLKGTSVNYDEKLNIKNDSQIVTLTHNTLEWINYLKHIKLQGFCEVKVEKVLSLTDMKDGVGVYSEVKDISSYEKEVEKAYKGSEEVVLTPDQKRIADLESKIEALSKSSSKKDKSDDPKELGKELSEARTEYETLYGKPPHHNSSLEKIQQDIEKKKQS